MIVLFVVIFLICFINIINVIGVSVIIFEKVNLGIVVIVF